MHILITAGPTREKIDPVRFISNRSTGKMGYAIARQAVALGHNVTLISGPVALTPPEGVNFVPVESAADMAQAVHLHAPSADMLIMSAAVADYRPAHPVDSKMKKQPGALFLELERTEDILASVGKNKRADQLLVGFAAETEELEAHALDKLKRKNLDWIVANYVADGFGNDTNQVILFNRNGEKFPIPRSGKDLIAKQIFEIITAVS
ncbi:MAG: bifunctional phosphopantothenoylcysteine decarboxylase/phosphopantothenate--cysteine ligase CoaBC [Lentisphaeria bacterium]|nr:bifunctional phosphopantothenoylcysteine decarboxylase/phosphopantothenate--cysteine ligase CoaBC [Lentisphaeria bacterium]